MQQLHQTVLQFTILKEEHKIHNKECFPPLQLFIAMRNCCSYFCHTEQNIAFVIYIFAWSWRATICDTSSV
jgi:hypothetical protein